MHSRLKFDISWRLLFWAAVGAPKPEGEQRQAQAAISSHWPRKRVVTALSVRTLFDGLLSELAFPAGTKILMSAINIASMGEIAKAHALEIIPVDIDPATLSPPLGALAEAQAQTGARICLTTQLYGAVNAIADAAELRRRGVYTIEDAAQAFTGAGCNGDTAADVTFFSFGPIKRRTALGGGIGLFHDPDLGARVEQRLALHPPLDNSWMRRRALKYILLKALAAPIPYALLVRSLQRLHKDVDETIGGAARGFSGPSLIEAIRRRPPDQMVALMARQIATPADNLERTEICRAFLKQLPADAVGIGVQTDSHAYWLLPIESSDPSGVISRLRRKGFDATRGATSLRALVPGETPRARQLLNRVVYLPHPAEMHVRDRQRLAQAVIEALACEATSGPPAPHACTPEAPR